MLINKTELTVKATVIEEGLIEQVEGMIKRNPRLFDNEKVVLMADTHKTSNEKNTNSVPVGFTMTLSKGLIPVDYVSADMFCGVSGFILKDVVLNKSKLMYLKKVMRDVVQVHRRYDQINSRVTDMGTLGGGNHFVEIGVNGNDTLIAVHSGSRAFGGDLFKKHKQLAILHTDQYNKAQRVDALQAIEPKERQKYLDSLPASSDLPLLDVVKHQSFWKEMKEAREFASKNREMILLNVLAALNINLDKLKDEEAEFIESVHNFVDYDTEADTYIVRKGAIKADILHNAIIPMNMRDGTLIGRPKNSTTDTNFSLPHGAGRVLSRTAAFDQLNLAQFEEDMKHVISPTVVQETLDESPRAYKSINDIISDIEPYLDDIRIFKPVFNFKGV